MTLVYMLGAGAIGLLHAAQAASWRRSSITLLLRKRPSEISPSTTTTRMVGIQMKDHQMMQTEKLIDCKYAVIGDINDQEPIDFLLVATKAFDTVKALNSIRNRLHSKSIILLLQNGALKTHSDLLETGLAKNILLGITTHGVKRSPLDPFSITRTSSTGSTVVGPIDEECIKNENLDKFKDWLQDAWSESLSFSYISDPREMRMALVRKLAVNSCINPLAAILERKNGQLLGKESLAIMEQVCKEITYIYPDLPELSVSNLLELASTVARNTAENTNSMLVDIQSSNKKTEIDYINGYIVQQAARLGTVQVPINANLTNLIKIKEVAA